MKNILFALSLLFCLPSYGQEVFHNWNEAQLENNIPKMKKDCRAYADEQVKMLLPVPNDSETNLSIKFYMLCVEEWFISRPDTYNNHF